MSGFAGFGGSLPPLGPGQGGAPVTCQEPIAITTGTAAIVTANLDMVGRVVSPDLLGVHTSAYDGNMQLATTPDLLKAAGIGSMRYPGGSYADLYHWESHTATWTPAAGAGGNGIYIARDTDFGSFVGFLERVGARAVITVNYGMNPQGTGPGVPQEAAAWVAYANGDAASTDRDRPRRHRPRLEDGRLLGDAARGRQDADRRREQLPAHQSPDPDRHQVLGDRERDLRQRLLPRQLRLGGRPARPLPARQGDRVHGPQGQPGAVADRLRHGGQACMRRR